MNIQAVRNLAPQAPVQAAQAAERTPDAAENPAALSQPAAPAYDTYTPGRQPEASGLYRVAHDKDGTPRIEYDDPETPERAAPESRTETTTINTDKVDQELRMLKEKREQMEKQLASASPEAAGALERQLSQIENELRQKDNDTYRRQNAVVS